MSIQLKIVFLLFNLLLCYPRLSLMSNCCKLYRYGNEVVSRAAVPLEKKDWLVEWPEYNPVPVDFNYNSKPWADLDIRDSKFKPKWNQLDGKIDRKSHLGQYVISKDGYPLNPLGRTGIRLRGILGRWGPNHAADPIVTRWKRNSNDSIITHPITNKPILQFVSIQRSDTKEWAIPGGMVDPGEKVSQTLKREFCEESLNILEMSNAQRNNIIEKLKTFFDPKNGQTIYKGYVDDPRNTDNAWMETVAVNFHDENGDTLSNVKLNAGDDAQSVQWVDIDHNLKLYANHIQFIEMTVKNKSGHW